MSSLDLLLYGQAGASVVMFIGWLVALTIRNTSYVDVLWAYGVGVLGLTYLYLLRDECHISRYALLLGLLGVWSARLGTHLLRRCWKQPEDARYAYLRDYLGKRTNLGFFFFFQVQAFWIVLFASPFLILARNPSELGPVDQLGLFIWIVGFTGVSLADKQLRIFKNAPGRTRGEVCDTGLWRYSRHPNYFFEWVLWLSYLLLGMNCPGAGWLLLRPFTSFSPASPGFPLWKHANWKPVAMPTALMFNPHPPSFPGFPRNQTPIHEPCRYLHSIKRTRSDARLPHPCRHTQPL